MGGRDTNINFAVADMFSLPFEDNSINVVFTCHALEPNGGHEKELLKELYRVSSQYLILIEPSYEFAGKEARERMERLGYISHLRKSADEIGLTVLSYDLYGISANELNPSGFMIIKKESKSIKDGFACPITKTPLKRIHDAYFSEESLLAYPILDGIPMLTADNAIVATKFAEYLDN